MEQPIVPGTDSLPQTSSFKVSASSPPQKVASALAHSFYEHPHQNVTVRAIGAGAVNQAVKACAIARGFVATRGMDLVVKPGFDSAVNNSGDTDLSAVILVVQVS